MKRIGEILIENGSVTQEQLTKALEQQKKEPGKLLGKILIEMGFVTEEEIVVALATQFNVPYLPIGNFDLTKTANGLLPKELSQLKETVEFVLGEALATQQKLNNTYEALSELEAAVTSGKVIPLRFGA